MKLKAMPDCFGSQAGSMLYGETPDVCLGCDLFDKCHKVTVAVSLQAISSALDLMVQNGLTDGQLKSFQELDLIFNEEVKNETNCTRMNNGKRKV